MTEFFGDNGENDPFWEELGREPDVEAEAADEPQAAEDPGGSEEAPVAAADAEPADEAAAEEQAAERARDEKGRFAKQEDTDAAALKAQIEALEKRLADKDDFAGRLSNELGELRKLQEQALEQQSRPQISDWDALIEDNPARAAQVALQAGDGYRYQQARQAWDELAPGAPDLFEHNFRLQKQLDELAAELKQGIAPIAEQQQVATTAAAYKRALEQYPDFDQHEETMQQIVDTNPVLKDALQLAVKSGDQDKQYSALSTIYQLATGRASDTLTAEAKKVAASLAQETLQAKQDAIVVSATSNASEPAQPKTWWDVAEADEQARAAGWNIS